MARLYADENFPPPVVERLRELGHDVQTVQEAGKLSRNSLTKPCWLPCQLPRSDIGCTMLPVHSRFSQRDSTL
jgi:hypothetical protein